MPVEEILILAVTKMIGGICIAGMSTKPDRESGLRWVRPVREFGHILLGDITTVDGQKLQPFDVVAFNLLRHRPTPPHLEDWITDFVYERPRIVRRLRGKRRAEFLASYTDKAPEQVLVTQQRSLCLIKPEWLRGSFQLDSYTGKLEARLAFGLDGREYLGGKTRGGLTVTDIRWRALGRSQLPETGGWTEFELDDLEARWGISQIYLALGLTRAYRNELWTIVVGVHAIPDFEVSVDDENL